MLIRIVKMSFIPEKVPDFLANFELIKEKIRAAKGNTFLELYQDISQPHIYFTYSVWESEEDLNKYRKSALFEDVWTFTKQLFNDKPEAWSVIKKVSLP